MDKLKRVTFNNYVNVILIPELKDFSEIKQDVWYNEEDFYKFSHRKENTIIKNIIQIIIKYNALYFCYIFIH